jgi:hypothetical protein
MAALTADRATPNRAGNELSLPVAASMKIYAGALVAMITSSTGVGNATKGATATNLRGMGVAIEQADNSGGAAGDISVKVRRGVWAFGNSASTDQITRADIGTDCYIVDDQTVAKTNGSNTRSVAGKVVDVDTSGVWVSF